MNVNKFKFHLISNDPNDDKLITKFKTMNNTLLLVQFGGKIVICCNKNNKYTFLNEFILEFNYYYSDYIFYNCKKSMIVLNDKQTIHNEVLSNRFTGIYKYYKDYKYKKVELFQICTN